MKHFHFGSFHVAPGGKDFEELHRRLDEAEMALRLGMLRIVVMLDGGREEREDARAYWRAIAKRLNVPCKESAASVELG